MCNLSQKKHLDSHIWYVKTLALVVCIKTATRVTLVFKLSPSGWNHHGNLTSYDIIAFWVISLINSWSPGWFEWNFSKVIFKLILVIAGWGISCEIAIKWMSLDLTNKVNIGSGNGLVPSGNKPLPDPMLIQFHVAKWPHQATLS